MKRLLISALALVGLTACGGPSLPEMQIPTDRAQKRTIVVTADATGKIEPINVVDIKSKAGGQIIAMPVETGTHVQKGDLIVDLDKADVNASLAQAAANLESAEARLAQSQTTATRQQQLFDAKVITQAELETSKLDLKTQNAAVLGSRQSLELAKQRVADATILAPSEGTILDKIVSLGTVIASASNSASGGTTLVRMANLSRVRARVLVSETDIGKLQVGMEATIKVDAFPNRDFVGRVEKMEPQAIVDQNVTMFPVMIELDNEDGALMPGMNGEVSILVERKNGVLAIPLDAFRLSNEAGAVGPMFGVSKEKVDSVQREGAQKAREAQSRILDDTAAAGGQVPVGRGAPAGNEARGAGGNATAAGGRGGADQRNPGGAGGQGGGRGAPVVVTETQCKDMTASIAKNAGLQKQIADITAAMGEDGADRRALMTQRSEAVQKAGIDPQVYSSCQRLLSATGGGMQNAGGRGGRGGMGGGGARGGGRGGGGGRTGGSGFAGANLGQRNQGLGVRGQGIASNGIVFVKTGVDTTVKPHKVTFEARYVQLGAQNYDFAEVTFGLKEGEEVALMAAAKIALQRQQAADRQKANSSLIPGMGGNQGRGMPGAGGDRGGGGAGPGGGGSPPSGGRGGGGGRGGD